MRANLAALRVVREFEAGQRATCDDELPVLAGWSGWGAVPQLFDPAKPEYALHHDELAELMPAGDLRAAARSTLNAHYTHPRLVESVWAAAGTLGFESGTFSSPAVGSARSSVCRRRRADPIGIELDPTTAAIAAAL